MEVKDYLVTSAPLKDQIDHYLELCRRGRYLDALARAEDDHGPMEKWQHTKLRILAIKALSHLGLHRSADAIIFRTWRRYGRDPLIFPYYLQALLTRKGPLRAWEIYESHEFSGAPDGFPEGADRAYLMCIKADIYSRFRDFVNADLYLEKAEKLDSGLWIKLRRVHRLQEADQHEAALKLCKQICDAEPDYLDAIHTYAILLQRNDQSQQALELLEHHWANSQSLLMGRLLCQIAIELHQFQTAHDSLKKMEKLMARGCPKYLRQEQDNLWADFYCARGDYDAALPYLEQKGFYQNRVSDAIRQRKEDDQRKILSLPYIQQRHMTCAPASIATVLQYWGHAADQDEIAEAICYHGTSNYDQRTWLIEQGWHLEEFELNFPQIKQLIDRDIPVLLSTVEPGSAHLQVIAGYDHTMGTYLLRDPSHPRLQEILIEESERYYASSGPRCTAVVPTAKAHLLDDMELRASALYNETYLLQHELRQHRYSAAQATAERMRARAPHHRLTLHAQLELAYYSQDDNAILQVTEQLLEQFPQDVNLQLGKIETLSRINAVQKSLQYMESLEESGKAHFLIRSRLTDSLRIDHRNRERVDKMLSELLRQNPLHPQTLYQYACQTCDAIEYEIGSAIYRFVACLEETNEQYASSYFRAERYRQCPDRAIEFLRDRFERFGKKSPGPAISLFQALDALERTEEGLQTLYHGMTLRPDDGELMLFTARRLLHLNRTDEAERIAEKAKPHTKTNRYLEVAAEICAHRLQRREAIDLWQNILSSEPLNYEACNSLTRLYIELGHYEQAITFLNNKIAEFPGNYQLQRMRLNWLATQDIDQIENYCQLLIESHPDDNWAYLKLADICLQRGRLNDALNYALEATRISRTDSNAWAQLGRVHLQRQEKEQAFNVLQRAIYRSPDCTMAFEPLLQCAHSQEHKKELLAFLQMMLTSAVTFGDGVLAYQKIASDLLPAEDLLESLRQILQQCPDIWQSWLAQANGYQIQGNLEQAEETLATAIERFPLVPQLHLKLAEILHLQGNLSGAEKQLRHTLLLAPNWSAAYNQLADLLEYQGKYSDAIALLETAIQRVPCDAIPHGYLADLLWKQGETQRALDTVAKSVELDPSYGWAWHKLCQWSQELGQRETAEKHIATARQTYPNSALLAEIDAEFRQDLHEKAEVLAAFAKVQPQNIDIACRLIQALGETGQFERAIQYCTADYWKGAVPIEIRLRSAWLTKQQCKTAQAIEQIREVAREAPHLYDAWRLLANWAMDSHEKNLALEALSHCQSLYPNDASVLTFVAEGLQRLEQDSAEILPLLERAFALEPSNQYNGLTYLDLLIETKDWSRAREVLDLIKAYSEDAFVLTRELQILAAEERGEAALLETWSQLLVHEQTNDWVMQTAWQVITDCELQAAASQKIEALRSQDHNVHPYSGYCLAIYQLSHMSFKKFEKQFLKLKHADAFTQRALEYYLDLLRHHEVLPSRHFTPILETLIASNTPNWGTYGLLWGQKLKWFKMRHWYSTWQSQDNLEAWMVYFVSLSHRECGDYQSGVEILEAAYQLPKDNYRGDIVCLHILDRILTNKRVTNEMVSEISEIYLDKLDPLAHYALALCRAIMAIHNGGFISRFNKVSPLLREAQRHYQKIPHARSAQQLKRQVRSLIKGTLRVTGLKKFFWYCRLSNHF
ncbi:tetratricopeptide repeat protein [Microbulbifer thermotolerans]|uniref:tetratricopeptide repeat protein n=1 Tax=Microbulbifer thermotolerans TaxID=252514 RepID=UPI00224AEAD5|nr:tetratricopeptide repeat protein [Microbulbifer thermotolerans]MCX2781752.1 tetratricopeptide repeat protein [Microbulbifer thermotolerans]